MCPARCFSARSAPPRAFSVLIVTFGTGYRAAKAVFNEGCGGDWVLTPEHLSGKIQPKNDLEY